MKAKAYLGDLSGGGLLVAESRTIAELSLQNLTDVEWKQRVVQDNILQKKSPQTALRFANVIRHRLNAMGTDYTQALVDASERACKQLLMAAFMVQSPVLVDFMQTILAEARRTYKPDISHDAWLVFINDRMQTFPELTAYSESTLKRMGSHVIKALVDTEYLQSTRQRKIQAVYVLPEVQDVLTKINQQQLIAVMECTQ